jgi:hypothetical protein
MIFPFLTTYDPPGTSEGTLDPMGLYQIADQLAMQLVPAVRERMQRIRFLTAIALGSLVTEGLEDDPQNRDASPCLVWEWLVVESLIREMNNDAYIWGVPGTLVARHALADHGYLDARSYLKTPRIFGFNGVYKRLAVHLGLEDLHLGPSRNTERLADAWARDLGLSGLAGAKPILSRWSEAISRSLAEKPAHTSPGWNLSAWSELARAFAPGGCGTREKRCLRELLLAEEGRLGALPKLWQLQAEFDDEGLREEALHEKLGEKEPGYRPLLMAIQSYEAFARSLQDAFDILKAEAARSDIQGFSVQEIGHDADFTRSVKGLCERFETAYRALAEVTTTSVSLQNLFGERFRVFADPMDAGVCAHALCDHHEAVQDSKSAGGKRPWFDRIGQKRIYVRRQFVEPRREIHPDEYVHAYRSWPIRRFYKDLS